MAGPLEVPPVQAPPLPEAIPDVLDFEPASFHTKNVKKQQFPLAVATGVVAVLLLVGLVVMVMNGSNGTPEPKSEVVSKPMSPPPKIKPHPVRPTPKPQPKVDPKPESQTEPKPEPEEPKADTNSEPEREVKPEPQAEPNQESEAEPESKEKLPVPDDAAQKKSLAIIRDVYKDEDRAALAEKLLAKAKETQNATDRFVLLREAKDVASKTWQGPLAFEVIDTMASEFDVSAPEMKAEVLEQAAKRPRITQDQKTAIAQAALKVLDEAVGEDNFDVAQKLGRLASQLVRQTKDKVLLQEIVAKNKEVDAAAKAYADTENAMATLKEKPDDPNANLVAGKYLCFSKGDWENGLPMLALGSDANLKALAEKDIAGADSAKEQVMLGDAWWDGQKEGRAAYWYEKALPGLAGLEKDRVEKRVRQAEEGPAGRRTLQAKQWSLAREFSTEQNPNKGWAYGWTPSLAGKFALLPKFQDEVHLGWHVEPHTTVAVNRTRNTVYGVLPGELSMHPSNTSHAVSRWTAPIGGRVLIQGKFGAGNIGLVDVYVLHKGRVLWSASNTPKDEPFNLEIRVQKGDTIDFGVGAGRNGHGACSTPVEAVISLKR